MEAGGAGHDLTNEEGLWLPAELWAMVCEHLSTGDLVRLSTTCWSLRAHCLSRVRHHSVSALGLVTSRRNMRQVLSFLSSLPCLVSLDLSFWDQFSDALVKHLPETLESVCLSHTSITARALKKLSTGLTSLDLGTTWTIGPGLAALSRLTSLRELCLDSVSGLRAEHLMWIPPSVEELDLSNTGIRLHQAGTPRSLLELKWPPALTKLSLRNLHLPLQQLYGMPSTLTKLDVSNCHLGFFSVDFDVCLPQLKTLLAQNVKIRRDEFVWESDRMWNLPSKLETLDLSGAELEATKLLAFLPASITALDLSHSGLCYQQVATGTQDTSAETYTRSVDWFNTLPQRLPHLKLLGLYHQLSMHEPLCLQVMRDHGVTVIHRHEYVTWWWGFQAAATTVDPSEVGPRENDPKWPALVKLCAEQRAHLQSVDPPQPQEGEHADEGLDKEESDEEDDEEDDEDGQGSLLFMGL